MKKRSNPKMQGAKHKNLQRNMSIKKVSSAKLTLDGEGDTFGSNREVTHRQSIKPKMKELSACRSLLCQTNARRRGQRFSVQIVKSHEGDPSNQKSKNRQLTEACSAKLTLKGEGDAFRFKSQSRMNTTHQTKNQRIVSLPKPALPN
jgi:hypothetical protein